MKPIGEIEIDQLPSISPMTAHPTIASTPLQPTLKNRRRTLSRWGAILTLLLFFGMAVQAAIQDSVTMDEPDHLSNGVSYAMTGDPRLNIENPPLINLLSGLFVRLTVDDIAVPTDSPIWQANPPNFFQFTRVFAWEANPSRMNRMVLLGRFPNVWLTMVAGALLFVVSQKMWGGFAGLASLMVFLLDPNILAHGHLITPDLGGASAIFAATMILWWRWQKPAGRPTSNILWIAFGLGFAFGSKLTSLGFIPIWGLLAILPLYPSTSPHLTRRVTTLISAGFLSLIVLWAIYGFDWGPLPFQDPQLRQLYRFGVPMPSFWIGVTQVLLLSDGGQPAYLMGRYSTQGFPLFFPIAFLVKTPVLTLSLFGTAVVLLLKRPQSRPFALFLLIPIVGHFLISVNSSLNIGYRHLLPIVPFIAILIGGLWGTSQASQNWRLAILPLLLIPAMSIHPYHLSYFNRPSGGPSNGSDLLIDSNIDWGQDFYRLKRWLDDQEIESIRLASFSPAPPEQFDITFEPLPGYYFAPELWESPNFDPIAPPPGIYVISITNLKEWNQADKTVYSWFRAREPDATIGYSISIYIVE